MRPLPGADGEPVNWLNYKTGVKDIYFRMDVGNNTACIAIELRHTDATEQEEKFSQFLKLKNVFDETVGNDWKWELQTTDEDRKIVSRISTSLKNVTIFNAADWPAIISFLKPRIRALDEFWQLVKDNF